MHFYVSDLLLFRLLLLIKGEAGVSSDKSSNNR